jgi:uncharacterized protein (DUF305 family)
MRLPEAGQPRIETRDGSEAMNHGRQYARLAWMAALSFAAMYVLMYAMVDSFSNVHANLNQLYMAGLMTGAMVLIELTVMRGMYPRRTLNAVIGVGAVVLTVCFWLAIRQQWAISDTQFLRSMIPHHASAILMCEEAPVRATEIAELCESILTSQSREIDWMETALDARRGRNRDH